MSVEVMSVEIQQACPSRQVVADSLCAWIKSPVLRIYQYCAQQHRPLCIWNWVGAAEAVL